MNSKYIVYCMLVIVACFAYHFLYIYKDMHGLLLHGYKTGLSLDDIKHLMDDNMSNFKGSITKMLALLGVIGVCVSFKKKCH